MRSVRLSSVYRHYGDRLITLRYTFADVELTLARDFCGATAVPRRVSEFSSGIGASRQPDGIRILMEAVSEKTGTLLRRIQARTFKPDSLLRVKLRPPPIHQSVVDRPAYHWMAGRSEELSPRRVFLNARA